MPGVKRSSAGAEKGEASKKPTSEGYQLFKDEKKSANARELVRVIIQQWESMDEEEKEHYENLAKKKGGGATPVKKGKSKAVSSEEETPEPSPSKGNVPRNESAESGITEGEASIQPEQIETGFIEKDVVAFHGAHPEEEMKVGRHVEAETSKSTAQPPVAEKTFGEKKTRSRKIPIQTA